MATAERRFNRGAWLTVAATTVLLLWPITLSLLFTTYPTDGWASTTEVGFSTALSSCAIA